MKNFTYTITDLEGIHARPAGLLVKLASSFSCSIKIEKDGVSVDAKRIFAVMGLGAKAGQQVIFSAEGSDEERAIAAVEEFMKENL